MSPNFLRSRSDWNNFRYDTWGHGNSITWSNHALKSLETALKAYLTHRQLIRADYKLEDLNIQNPYPRSPRLPRSDEFRGKGCLIDPRSLPTTEAETDAVFQHITELDLKLFLFFRYLERVSSTSHLIARYMRDVPSEELYKPENLYRDCDRLNHARGDLHFYLKVAKFGDSISEVYGKVSEELSSQMHDNSTSSILLRGLAVCMSLSLRELSENYELMLSHAKNWLETAFKICQELQLPAEKRIIDSFVKEIVLLTDELVSEDEDETRYREERERKEQERLANDIPVGQDIMRHS